MPEKLRTVLQVLCALFAGIVATLLAHTHSFAQNDTAQAALSPAKMLLAPAKGVKRAGPY